VDRRLTGKDAMALVPLIEYADAAPGVRAVYDDIMATRRVASVNNFWKALAHDPANLKRVWATVKEVMAPGALDPLVKELLYIAVSVTNNCEYCIHSHTAGARAKGMSPAMFDELLAVVALANATNRLANGYRIDVDPQFRDPLA
jgi:AhpD family alkylhydroperoxidase